MIAMKFTIELDIGLSFLLQVALPQLVTDRETKTHRRAAEVGRKTAGAPAMREKQKLLT
jgi:hypothetical protein